MAEAPPTDRFNVNLSLSRNYEFLKSRYVGTGHPDISRAEWGVNIQRDTLASHVGHADQLAYFALAANDSVARTRYEIIEKMIDPLGTSAGVKKTSDVEMSATTTTTSSTSTSSNKR
jgi:splicing factor 3B subunit 5